MRINRKLRQPHTNISLSRTCILAKFLYVSLCQNHVLYRNTFPFRIFIWLDNMACLLSYKTRNTTHNTSENILLRYPEPQIPLSLIQCSKTSHYAIYFLPPISSDVRHHPLIRVCYAIMKRQLNNNIICTMYRYMYRQYSQSACASLNCIALYFRW